MWSASRSFDVKAARSLEVPSAAQLSQTENFARASCKILTAQQIESYIDPRITGRARTLAYRAMIAEPVCRRQNVEGIDDVPYSNTWEGLQQVRHEARLIPTGNGLFIDPDDGSIVVPSMPVTPSLSPLGARPHAGGTGAIYKYVSPPGHSAVSGEIEIPQCGWINNVAAQNVPFWLFGGTAGSVVVDAGVGWNGTSTVQLYYQDTYKHKTPLSGNVKYPCTLSGAKPIYLEITLGITANATSTTGPQFYMQAVPVYIDGSRAPFSSDAIGPITLTAAWSVSCAACTMKREFNIAQKPGTNENSGTNFAMEDTFDSGDPIQEVRTPLESFINVSVGTFESKAWKFSAYLGGTAPIISPSNLPSKLKLLTFLGPNVGTETPGMILKNCQTGADCQAAPGAALP
ncbi:MAG TPA: hypothetical protein VMH02_01440 [Verrucomicrobiae bacterium]|nr:hypothetical protein [Verrucomicrobiae bacterium]